MKIVVLEANALGKDIDLSAMKALGEVVIYEETTNEEVRERIKEADIVVINRVIMNEETLKSALSVKLICVTGTGVNMIDFAYCQQRGIEVKNVPDYCTDSVAQHTFTMALYLMEKLVFYEKQVSGGQYIKGKKQDSIFINLGRGGIVSEEEISNPLFSFHDKTRLVITPHIGWASIEARNRVVEDVCNHIKIFARKV